MIVVRFPVEPISPMTTRSWAGLVAEFRSDRLIPGPVPPEFLRLAVRAGQAAAEGLRAFWRPRTCDTPKRFRFL